MKAAVADRSNKDSRCHKLSRLLYSLASDRPRIAPGSSLAPPTIFPSQRYLWEISGMSFWQKLRRKCREGRPLLLPLSPLKRTRSEIENKVQFLLELNMHLVEANYHVTTLNQVVPFKSGAGIIHRETTISIPSTQLMIHEITQIRQSTNLPQKMNWEPLQRAKQDGKTI